MLADLAARDGFIKWIEGDEPYPLELIQRAMDLGVAKCYGAGGMASTDMMMDLTPAGRRQLGLPERLNVVERVLLWFASLMAKAKA